MMMSPKVIGRVVQPFARRTRREGNSCLSLLRTQKVSSIHTPSHGESSNITDRLLAAARGGKMDERLLHEDKDFSQRHIPYQSCPQLKSYPLQTCHIAHKVASGSPKRRLKLETPTEFHEELCTRIRSAQKRILIATLYVGPAASSNAIKEEEFLEALCEVSSRQQNDSLNSDFQVKVIMDASRGQRPVSRKRMATRSENVPATTRNEDVVTTTSSASAVHSRIQTSACSNSNSDNGVYLCHTLPWHLSWLPSPLNEAAGVFHMKVRQDSTTLANLAL
jgi:hypothetical protein